MFKLLRRSWKYFVAALTGNLDEIADPKVQIEQAITEAKEQHERLSQQAAAVLGNRRQLELKLDRAMEDVEKTQASARQALVMADQARKAGDEAKAAQYEATAQTFATKLVMAEKSMQELMALHESALKASEQAKKAVEQNAMLLQRKLSERTKLLSQLEATKMQERMHEAMASVSSLAVPGDVPSLDEVREKIETRYAKALGESEIRTDSVGSKMMEVEKAQLDAEAASRLDALRDGLGLAPALTTQPSSTVETGGAAATGVSVESPQQQVRERE